MNVQIVDCPLCALPADILDVQTFAGAGGPVELTRTRCVSGHIVDSPRDAQAVD